MGGVEVFNQLSNSLPATVQEQIAFYLNVLEPLLEGLDDHLDGRWAYERRKVKICGKFIINQYVNSTVKEDELAQIPGRCAVGTGAGGDMRITGRGSITNLSPGRIKQDWKPHVMTRIPEDTFFKMKDIRFKNPNEILDGCFQNRNYLISPNEFTTEKLRSSFAYEGEVLEYGYPRNDILYNYTDEMVDKIKSDLNLPKDKKVILYAPTWRDDESYDIGKVRFNLKLDLDNLKESLSDEYIVLIRTHYFIANNLDLSRFEGFVFDVSKYEDIAELYLISDILITDYSSVFFDFANLKRPILFYTYDLDKYSNMLRGFYMDIHTEVPGPLLYTTDEVVDAIKNIDSVNMKYHDRYEEFYKRFCSIDDGNASKRIVEKIWG